MRAPDSATAAGAALAASVEAAEYKQVTALFADVVKKFVRTARRYRTVKIKAGRQILTAADPLPDDLREAIARISGQLEH